MFCRLFEKGVTRGRVDMLAGLKDVEYRLTGRILGLYWFGGMLGSGTKRMLRRGVWRLRVVSTDVYNIVSMRGPDGR